MRLLAVEDPDARAFYETEARRSGWSVRQLDRQISSHFYERILLSKNRGAMIRKAELRRTWRELERRRGDQYKSAVPPALPDFPCPRPPTSVAPRPLLSESG